MKLHSISPALPHSDRPLTPEIIVLHATAGRESPDSSVANAVSTLRDRGLSYHFLIAKDGTVYEGVSPSRVAFHAGSSYGPREQRAKVSTKQYANTAENRKLGRVFKFVAKCGVNPYSIGISFVNLNDGHDPYPEVQIASAVALVTALKQQFPGIQSITTHFAISPKRKSDPVGPGFDFHAFAKACGLPAWERA